MHNAYELVQGTTFGKKLTTTTTDTKASLPYVSLSTIEIRPKMPFFQIGFRCIWHVTTAFGYVRWPLGGANPVTNSRNAGKCSGNNVFHSRD